MHNEIKYTPTGCFVLNDSSGVFFRVLCLSEKLAILPQCHLCLSEKLAILLAKPDTLLNKRSELVAKCRHRNKFKLNKFVT